MQQVRLSQTPYLRVLPHRGSSTPTITSTKTTTTRIFKDELGCKHVLRFAEVVEQFVIGHYPYGLCALPLIMTSFFVQWALWEKMTFCLALAIVLAIILGCAKNLYTRWKLRNYSTMDARLIEPTPNMIEATLSNKYEAPFGIRALESGVEIEGVWISNPTTPATSCPGSPSSSAAGSTSSSFLDEPTTPSFALIETPRTGTDSTLSSVPSWYAPSKRMSQGGSTASWTIDSNGFKHIETYRPRPASTSAADRSHKSSHSITSCRSDSSSIDRGHKRSLTSSSDGNYKPHSSSTVPTSPTTSSHNSEQTKASREDSEQLQTATVSATGKAKGNKHEPKADLGLLYSHRLSHVAETGQLIPRSKRSPAPSGEWSRATPIREPRPRHPPISLNNRRISRSLPTSPTAEKQDPFKMMTTSSAVPNASVTMAKGHKAPIVDTAEPESFSTPCTPESMPVFSQSLYERHSGAISAVAMLSKPKAVHSPTSFEHDRGSEILRRVNDDFEILCPGTIPDAVPANRASRPQTIDQAKRHSRRLSKERPSTSRDRNSFIEVLYGNESQSRR